MNESVPAGTDLIKMFVEASKPQNYTTTLKFKTLNNTLFEIELSTNTNGDVNQQLYDLVKASVEAATQSLISAK